ncbi:hypothetical protein BGZ76_000180 [Entomortierella beljakovae]|nr:hypothetical protein BGZ76_000180 [Entomortierella beljakovae]
MSKRSDKKYGVPPSSAHQSTPNLTGEWPKLSELKVLIVGAGMSGLLFGALCQRMGIQYEIFERNEASKRYGGLMSLNAGILPALEQLGIYDRLVEKSHPIFCTNVIDEAAGRRFEVRIKGYREREYHGSFLVGADGAYSHVRQCLYDGLSAKDLLPPQDKTGFKNPFIALHGTTNPLPVSDFKDVSEGFSTFTQTLGKDKLYAWSTLTVPGNRICWVVQKKITDDEYQAMMFRKSSHGFDTPEDMIGEVKHLKTAYGSTIGTLIDYTPHDSLSKVWTEDKVFNTWYHGRTVLIGDAIHKLLPNAGQGAVNAMQDAVVLANCIYDLSVLSKDSLEDAFRRYKELRMPHVMEQYEASRRQAKMTYNRCNLMKSQKRGNNSGGTEKGRNDQDSNATVASSATSTSFSQHSTSATHRHYSSSSTSNASNKNTTKNDTSNTVTSTQQWHSKTMLLELLLTVTRSSMIILTPLVAGMVLRVAPSMMDPIYGSIFVEDHFLKYSLISTGVGVVLAMIYVYFSGMSKSTGSSSSSRKAKDTKTNKKNAIAAGLRKDRRIRKGILFCLDSCALILATSFITTHTMFKHSGEFGPWRGPHLTQLLFAYPVLALLGFANTLACVLRSYERVHMAPQGRSCPRIYTSAILISVISGLHKMLIFVHGDVALPDERLEEQRKPKPSSRRHASLVMSFVPLVIVLALTAQNATRNPQCQAGVTKAHNPPAGNYTILARNESITGWISVVDEHTTRHDFHIRVMRAGHSLIGGMYAETGDSIFGPFYIPEAVRLIKNREKGQTEVALQIGLGVGIASSSLIQHGVLMDVVEIDPVVADYASTYFDWPQPNELFIQDGRQFIEKAPDRKYDYVIHDVFTGGGVPPSLFSLEALNEIKRIMKPDGVLALNMVGSEHPSKSQALNSVRRTLHAAFKHVAGFKESPDEPEAYQNIVFFASQIPIEFEDYTPPPHPTDEEVEMLQQEGGHFGHAMRPSVMRDWILTSFQGWTLSTPYDPNMGELILDRNNTLNNMQRAGAEDHWHAMRSLLPLDFWINY